MLIRQIAQANRQAALIFNRQIKLMMKRGQLKFKVFTYFDPYMENFGGCLDLLDSFNWELTPQGFDYWSGVWDQVELQDD